MNRPIAQRILGVLLMMFSATMLLPMLIGIFYGDETWLLFGKSFSLILAAGAAFWYPVRNLRKELGLRDGFLIVASFWMVLGSAGSLPFYLADVLSMSFTDSVFESMSGLTTTGATVLTGLDTLPRSILFYRQQLQWFGGMGDHCASRCYSAYAWSWRHAAVPRRDPGPRQKYEVNTANYGNG